MEISKIGSNFGLIDKICLEFFKYLSEERSRRWGNLLRKTAGLEKVTVYEFLDVNRRSTKVTAKALQGWPELKLEVDQIADVNFYGVYWDSRHKSWEVTGRCRDVLPWFSSSRVDCWLIFEGQSFSLVATHERRYEILKA
jgi:hypothetical protein